jgi:hypothetical protein
MKLSKALESVLLATLLQNTAESRKVVGETKDVDTPDAYGIKPSEYDFFIETYNKHYPAAVMLVELRLGRYEVGLWDKIYTHLTNIIKARVPTRLPYKSLSVLIAADAQVQAGHALSANQAFIYLHSEKGYYLGLRGQIGDYNLVVADYRTLKVASDAQVKACVAALNTEQRSKILTHPYFGEIRNAVLQGDADEETEAEVKEEALA